MRLITMDIDQTAHLIDKVGRFRTTNEYVSVTYGIRVKRSEHQGLQSLVRGITHAYPDAVFAGRSAARLHAIPFVGSDATRLEVYNSCRIRRRGITQHSGYPAPEDIVEAHGYRCTSLLRTVVDVVRFTNSPDERIAMLDQCLRTGKVTEAEVMGYLIGRRGMRGGSRIAAACALADAQAESPPESLLRVWLHQAGFGRLQPQVGAMGGRYRLDLGDPEAKVGVEYDGAGHAEVRQHERDCDRINELQQAGWAIILVTRQNLHSPQALTQIAAAYARTRP